MTASLALCEVSPLVRTHGANQFSRASAVADSFSADIALHQPGHGAQAPSRSWAHLRVGPLPGVRGCIDPLYVDYHDTRMGRCQRRMGGSLGSEKAHFSTVPGRAVLDHHPRNATPFRAHLPDSIRRAIARFDEARIGGAMNDAGIVRNRAKIVATIAGAPAGLGSP